MKITNIKISMLERPGVRRLFELTMIPGMRRPRWIHGSSAATSGETAEQAQAALRHARHSHPGSRDDDERRRPVGPVAHLRGDGPDPVQRKARHHFRTKACSPCGASWHDDRVERHRWSIRPGPRPSSVMHFQHFVLRVLRWGTRAGRQGSRYVEPVDTGWRSGITAGRSRMGRRVGLGLLQQ